MLDAVPQRPIGVVPADLLELYFEIKPSGTDSSAWLLIREELVKRGHPPRTWTAIKEKKGELESRGRRELGSCLNLEQSFVPGYDPCSVTTNGSWAIAGMSDDGAQVGRKRTLS